MRIMSKTGSNNNLPMFFAAGCSKTDTRRTVNSTIMLAISFEDIELLTDISKSRVDNRKILSKVFAKCNTNCTLVHKFLPSCIKCCWLVGVDFWIKGCFLIYPWPNTWWQYANNFSLWLYNIIFSWLYLFSFLSHKESLDFKWILYLSKKRVEKV